MKKFFGLLLVLLILFLVLTYWSVSVGPEKIKISEVIAKEGLKNDVFEGQDSVVVIASNRYKANALKRFMQGVNYRKAWATPIKAPVFYMDSMKIIEEGGGTQTHSLRLKSPRGNVYSMRSINKDPEPLVPEIAKKLALQNIVIDGISAQHPYGAVLAAALSDHARILHTHPKIVFTPQQPGLENYSDNYGNKLYLLEYETEGPANWTNLPNVQKILDTKDLQEMKLKEGKNLKIDERTFVRARLFDLLIGDWDRHAKQWGWVVQKQEDQLLAIPLAGDRDNAFFRIDGVLPTIMTNELIQPLVRPFEKDIDHVPGYVYPVDVYFLNNTSEEIFIEEAERLQKMITDEKIDEALEAWPEQIRALNGAEIAEKLKSRREKLVEYARAFQTEIQDRNLLKKSLKGSEDLQLEGELKKCFECAD